jgi:hypothetical protein
MPTERPPLLGEVLPTFGDRGCCVVSATDPPSRILGFLDQSCYYFFHVDANMVLGLFYVALSTAVFMWHQ